MLSPRDNTRLPGSTASDTWLRSAPDGGGLDAFTLVITRRMLRRGKPTDSPLAPAMRPRRTASQTFRALPPSIWALGLAAMFMDMSSELVHSLLPVFLASVLGASMVTIGILEGIAEATATITKVFSGAISDYVGKRKFLVVRLWPRGRHQAGVPAGGVHRLGVHGTAIVRWRRRVRRGGRLVLVDAEDAEVGRAHAERKQCEEKHDDPQAATAQRSTRDHRHQRITRSIGSVPTWPTWGGLSVPGSRGGRRR